MKTLLERKIYLDKLISFKDIDLIKVITGIRRSGKSSLLKLMVLHLRDSGINPEQIIEINFESFKYRKMAVEDLYKFVESKVIKGKKMYLFFDELQRIEAWEEAINSFRIDFDCDIYITGSNAYLLSSEYSTYLSGRSVEINILPLSFREFVEFNKSNIFYHNTDISLDAIKLVESNKKEHSTKDLFELYLLFGGMPAIFDLAFDSERIMTLLDGVYSTVVLRDILERYNVKNARRVTDPILLRKIILFLADNVGNNVSATKIGNVLLNEGLLQNRKGKPSTHTIQSYVNSLLESYVFYEAKRFDVKGKDFLRTLGKYYIVDIGLRNYLLGYRDRDRGHILENIVYLELIRRGYDVSIGKIKNLEIDFIASKFNKKLYFQVTESMQSEDVRERELNPLKMLDDNYEKVVLSLDQIIMEEYQGIKSKNLISWLLEEE